MTTMSPPDGETRQIVASFDGVDLPDAVLKCQQCKVDAKGVFVNREYVTISCPNCGIRIDGEGAHTMFLKQAQYHQIQELRKKIADEFGSSGYFNHQPGDEITEPDWPFFLDFGA